eukprot:g1003.t1
MASLLASSKHKLANLVVDAGPIIRGEQLAHLAHTFWTVPEVIAEIRDSKSRARLQALPYELKVKEPSATAMRAVTTFAKKTGDLQALSLNDLKVIALTYMLETQENGSDHLRKEPVSELGGSVQSAQPASAATKLQPGSTQRQPANKASVQAVASASPSSSTESKVAGTDKADTKEGVDKTTGPTTTTAATKVASGSWAAIASKPAPKVNESSTPSSSSSATKNSRHKEEVIAASAVARVGGTSGADYFTGTSDLARAAILAASEKSDAANAGAAEALESKPLKATSRILTAGVSSSGNMDRGEDIAAEDDGEGWVNESNVDSMATAAWGKGTKSVHVAEEDDIAAAGCITTDFAMQNVILQIGLKLLAVDGRTIRRLKQWVYKCDACFFISSKNLGTTFCPRCGSNAMARLSVRVGADGTIKYGYNPYRRISTRGQRYAIAKRKGGRGGQGLVLRADQVKMGTWNIKAREKQKLRSQFGEDITGSLGLDLQKAGGTLQAGFGRRNPNKMRGRERRGKKGLRKKKGKRFNPYRTDNTA